MIHRSKHMTASCIATVVAIAIARDARATDAEAQAAAESLFKDARKLVTEERFAEACPKFAESQRLDPAAGTLMNLADCYERTGKTASAWVTFTEAAKAAAERHRPDWRATALDHARALESQLSHLVIVVPAANAASGLAITRDGVAVSAAEWGADIPVDPGVHVVVARAPGRIEWTSSPSVLGPRARVVVTVPPLDAGSPEGGAPPIDSATMAPPAPAPLPRDGSPLHTLGFVGVGAGALGIVVGLAAGTVAWTKKADADRSCPASPCADAAGLSANDTAHQAARVATIAFVAGLVLTATGVTLLLVSPPRRAARTGLVFAPAVGPAGASLDVGGSF